MKLSKPFMMLICVLALACAASAAQIVVRDPDEGDPGDESSPPIEDYLTISSPVFSFTSPSGTSPATPENPLGTPCIVNGVHNSTCGFVNNSGVDWTTLRVIVTPVQTFDICGIIGARGKFTDCNPVDTGGSGPVIVDFFGGTGIPYGSAGSAFKLELVGWEPNTQFTVQANIPEPATAMATGGGILLLAWFRRTSRSKRIA